MKNKKIDVATILLLLIPIIIAISQLVSNFNLFDLTYLLLVAVIFVKYFIRTKVQKLYWFVFFCD